jgi:cysteine synthase
MVPLANGHDLQALTQQLSILNESVGRTTLYELWPGSFPNGARVFAKAEYSNPSGSHYDRIYTHLFHVHLHEILEQRVDVLVEVSSGNAAASFAWFCRQLGFPCAVMLPKSLPNGFVDHILELNPNADIYFGERSSDYVSGAVMVLRQYMKSAPEHMIRIYPLNHSRDPETLNATEVIANEAIQQLHEKFKVSKLDYYIAACGNGSTIIGPGRVLSAAYDDLRVIGFEPEEAPMVQTYLSSHRYKPSMSGSRHYLFGTGVWGVRFPFLHDQAFGLGQLLKSPDDVLLIDKKRRQKIRQLACQTGGQFGFTSLASIALAFEVSQESRNAGATFLVILYDRGAKYDGLELN